MNRDGSFSSTYVHTTHHIHSKSSCYINCEVSYINFLLKSTNEVVLAKMYIFITNQALFHR